MVCINDPGWKWKYDVLKNSLLPDRYPSDDINKFLWMVRIGGGVFPDIKEKDFLGEGGYRVDSKAGKVNIISPP